MVEFSKEAGTKPDNERGIKPTGFPMTIAEPNVIVGLNLLQSWWMGMIRPEGKKMTDFNTVSTIQNIGR